ncbi:MAG: hypothetical protein Q8861_14290 [Bacteroidota bacterium]|nr:hypothetical protein [Bacteroidota bacterium]
MKSLKLIIVGVMLLFAGAMQAQVSININLGSVPSWGPRVQEDVRYYYLPDVDAYYDLRTAMFVFSYNGCWVRQRHLPEIYRNYNLYDGRKIVMRNYYGDSPYSYYRGRGEYRDNRMAQRQERNERRYDEFNDRRMREDHNWRDNDDRQNFRHDNGRGHGQRRGWKD